MLFRRRRGITAARPVLRRSAVRAFPYCPVANYYRSPLLPGAHLDAQIAHMQDHPPRVRGVDQTQRVRPSRDHPNRHRARHRLHARLRRSRSNSRRRSRSRSRSRQRTPNPRSSSPNHRSRSGRRHHSRRRRRAGRDPRRTPPSVSRERVQQPESQFIEDEDNVGDVDLSLGDDNVEQVAPPADAPGGGDPIVEVTLASRLEELERLSPKPKNVFGFAE